MKKKKLLIVSDYFYPHWTGIAKSFYYLLDVIPQNVDICILTVRFKKKLSKKYLLKTNVTILRESPLFLISRAMFSFTLLITFLNFIKEQEIILINCPSIHVLPVALITKLYGKKLYIFHQGDLILPKGLMNRVIERIFDACCFISFSLADKLSTYSLDYALHSRVLKPFIYKVEPILMPVIVNKKKHKDENITKKIDEIKNGKVLFGFAGRFVEEKGFDILFDAIPLIIQKIPSAHFVFAGDRNIFYEDFFNKNRFKYEKVKQYITFLGLLSDAQLLLFYQAIDCIIIPSRSDCFNLVQAEAMMCGTPSVVSDIPGARFLVKKTGFGYTFEKGNAEDLTNKLTQIVANKDKIMLQYTNVLHVLDNKKNEQAIRKFIAE